ncbi:HAMP domain-containing sensor histidine kinase [Streptomyces sp. MS2.AVA.5]|uniref:HAMP domain-containing sensor histidine kinase n=1 Tax=Streptomyces achmelvichensis TaxID=3134111 RepID=A0ACC6Q916_9ACTN
MVRTLRVGLRARFIVAFLLTVTLGTLLSAGFIVYQARQDFLETTQNHAIASLRTALNSMAPDLPFPPDSVGLHDLASQLDRTEALSWHSSVAYRDGDPVSASAGAPPVPQQLRDHVQHKGQAAYQRINWKGQPWFYIGMPVAYAHDTELENAGKLSGLTVYTALSLEDDRKDIATLTAAARTATVPALTLALLLALLAARSVLRPVQRLRNAADRIASGELGYRLRVRGHDELAGLALSFNTMAANLQQDDTQRRRMEAGARRFAADVAHELRTPLAAMTPVTDLLAEDAASQRLPPDTAEAIQLVTERIRAFTSMIEDLIEMSRFDARAARLHEVNMDLRTVVTKSLKLRGWSTGDQIQADLPAPIPVSADPRRIDAILANLIDNALRHGRPPVIVTAHVESHTAVLTVTDHGRGIPEDELPHVFERFYRAKATHTTTDGSGIGLALAQENALLHGGTLTAANAPTGGAVFTLTLPLSAPEDSQ